MTFAFRKQLRASYDEALARVPDALKSEGFGVLTEIDVQRTFAQKLGVEFRKYKILGACNPDLAHRALGVDLELGVMLPCNVIVYEGDDGRAVVAAIDPMQTMAAQGDPQLAEIAATVKDKLGRALATLE